MLNMNLFLLTNHFSFSSSPLETISHLAHLEHHIQDKGKRLAGFLILVLAAVPMILALFYQAHKYHTMGHESMVSRMKKYLSHHSGEHSGHRRKRQKTKMWRPKRRQLLGYKRTEYWCQCEFREAHLILIWMLTCYINLYTIHN